ncbi:PASTA domain-containing protein [Nonomuraea typhae]|uniref:PASTA domain-containing protein n=1 Tax=Nonomuraea typhae TaxID=2603600 RepID=UPI0012F77531|nr:PASTA domain-containing protein [Nonomuraea typhae]
MNVEEELREAMARHVADVHAAPAMGRSVRRARRRRAVVFRTAGAALVTAAVAATVPMVLSSNEPAPRNTGVATAGVSTKVTVPDVNGLKLDKAVATLKAAGLAVDDVSEIPQFVTQQHPAAGEEVEPGTKVTLYSAPQDLGDLGDGRKFGGIEITYLPEGMSWGRWSGKNGFGKNSYTTSFEEPDNDGAYSIQIVVYEGEASEVVGKKLTELPGQGAETVEIKGKKGYLAALSEDTRVVKEGEQSDPELVTHTLGWKLRDDLAVEIMMSPFRAKKLAKDQIKEELVKIAEGIHPISE